jgi:hypothetical protein
MISKDKFQIRFFFFVLHLLAFTVNLGQPEI